MISQTLCRQKEYLTQEIKNVQDEMDRTDSFDSYKYHLRKRLTDLNNELDKVIELLRSFEAHKETKEREASGQ